MTDTPEDALLTFLRAAPIDDEPEDQPRRSARMNDRLAEIRARMAAARPMPMVWNCVHCRATETVYPDENGNVKHPDHTCLGVENYRLLAAQRALVAELAGALEGLVDWHDVLYSHDESDIVRLLADARAALEHVKETQG